MKRVFICLAALLMALPGFAQTTAPQRPRSMTIRRAASLGYLGVGVVDLTDERVKALKLKDDSGVEVKRVDENSPAARAGLKLNDVVLGVNGKAVDDIEDFQNAIAGEQPGTKVTLTIWRDGAKKTVCRYSGRASPTARLRISHPIRPNARCAAAASQASEMSCRPSWLTLRLVGFYGEELNSQTGRVFRSEGRRSGICSLAPNTAAARSGLKAGDVVV